MKQRTITAFFFALVMLGGIYWSRLSCQLLFTLIAVGMLWEFLGLVIEKDEPQRLFKRIVGCVLGILPVLSMGLMVSCINYFGTRPPDPEVETGWHIQVGWSHTLLILIGFFTMLVLIFELFWPSKTPGSTVGKYLFGIFYIGLPFVFLFLLTPDKYTPNRVFGLLLLIWTNDVIAYLVGSRFGKTKLLERVSPKKTWEGTIGGAIGTVVVATLVLSGWIPDYNPDQWLALGLIVAVLATPGDLIESLLKRSAGVKDSGSLMPGHGGLLDRFDSFIFVLPFAWLAVILLGG
jgi:phosphatidate cytidylyltransferase